jgi:biuret amidohydrolase
MTDVDLDDAALLLMDFHNDVTHREGKFAPAAEEQHRVDEAVENAAKLLDWARKRGMPVAHVAVRYRPGHPEIDARTPMFKAVAENDALVEGSWGARFCDELAPLPEEWVVTKRGVDGFAGNDLARLLTLAQKRTVLLAGVQTNAVVLATALISVDHGLRPVIVADACAGGTAELHRQALQLASIVAAQVATEDLLAE